MSLCSDQDRAADLWSKLRILVHYARTYWAVFTADGEISHAIGYNDDEQLHQEFLTEVALRGAGWQIQVTAGVASGLAPTAARASSQKQVSSG
jgi:hypothetical protein